MALALWESFNAARTVATPLIGIQSPDPAATIELLSVNIPGKLKAQTRLVKWDGVQGFVGIGEASRQLVSQLYPQPPAAINVVTALQDIYAQNRFPGDTIFFMQNLGRYFSGADGMKVLQHVWNMRDVLKSPLPKDKAFRTMVMLGTQINLPPELEHDFLVLTERLPDASMLEKIVLAVHENTGVAAPDARLLARAKSSLRGMSSFAAEQISSMAMTTKGMNIEHLLENARSKIERTQGLSVYRGKETFKNIRSLGAIRDFLSRLFTGKRPPELVIMAEEFEKMMAGASGDNTGVQQDAMSVILDVMENKGWTGLIAVGGAGTGKSLLAKATGNEFGCEAVKMDLGATRSKGVGDSEKAIRNMMNVAEALAGENGAFVIASCNSLKHIPAELRRRFRNGIWYFPFPGPEDKDEMWKLNLRAEGLPLDLPRPNDKDYNGSDIRNVVEIASRTSMDLLTASRYIVPVKHSDPETIAALEEMATGRFLDANLGDRYGSVLEAVEEALQSTPRRRANRPMDMN